MSQSRSQSQSQSQSQSRSPSQPRSQSCPRVFSREFKVAIINRMMAGENVSALARELRLSRKDVSAWRDRFLAGGPEALHGRGRPPRAGAAALAKRDAAAPGGPDGELTAARSRIAELERKIGQQQLELDFFRQALRQAGEARQKGDGPGVTASTRSSRR
jgi:transposase